MDSQQTIIFYFSSQDFLTLLTSFNERESGFSTKTWLPFLRANLAILECVFVGVEITTKDTFLIFKISL